MTDRFDKLWRRTQQEIPGVRIILHSESRLRRLLFWLLSMSVSLFSFGKADTDWSSYTSTIGRTLYVPDTFWEWSDVERYVLLRHELVHLRQFRCWPFPFLGVAGLWRINAFVTGMCYLFFPIPVFWTFRAKFEREGYTQSMLTYWEVWRSWRSMDSWDRYVLHMEDTFGGSRYFWMWTRDRARRWAISTLGDIVSGRIVNTRDDVDGWDEPAA